MPGTGRGRWFAWLAILCAASLIGPVAWILTHYRHAVPTGDAFYFHWQAQYIANGTGWFVNPFPTIPHHTTIPSAEHPPLWVLVLALADVVGIQSYLSQLLMACVIGAAAVFVTGLAAREVAGPRAGLIAAAIAAVYPNYWINYGLGLSETLVLLLVAAVILVAVRLWRRPTLRTTVVLGLLCGLAAVTRAEQVLLMAVLLVPLILLLKGVTLRRRLQLAGVGVLVALAVITPWIGFNLARFSHATYFSNDSGTAIAMANCHSTYYGAYLGAGDFRCIARIKTITGDESTQDAYYRHAGLTYLNAHSNRLPVVVVARAAREFGLFRPIPQLHLENDVNGRPLILGEIGLGAYYALALAAVFGAVSLRRRRVTLMPFAAVLIELVAASMLTFGQTRYRAPIEVVLVVLAAVAADAVLARRSRPAAGAPLPSPEPPVPALSPEPSVPALDISDELPPAAGDPP